MYIYGSCGLYSNWVFSSHHHIYICRKQKRWQKWLTACSPYAQSLKTNFYHHHYLSNWVYFRKRASILTRNNILSRSQNPFQGKKRELLFKSWLTMNVFNFICKESIFLGLVTKYIFDKWRFCSTALISLEIFFGRIVFCFVSNYLSRWLTNWEEMMAPFNYSGYFCLFDEGK